MDRTDKKILALLTQNARISAAEIGRHISLSRTSVQERITRLETQGVITGYHAQLAADPVVRAILSVKIADRPCDKALTWLAELEGVQEVQSLSGDIDAIVSCALPDLEALSQLNDRVGASPLISEVRSHVVLRQIRA